MLNVEKCSSAEDFRVLEEEWNVLLVRSEADNLFLTWQWLYTWWEVYKDHGEKELSIFLIRGEDGELLGIAPLYASTSTPLRAHTLRFLGSYGLGSDYLDFIFTAGREEEIFNVLMSYLKSSCKSWNVIELSDISEDSPNFKLLKEEMQLRCRVSEHTTCPFLPLPKSWEALHASFSKNLRYDVNRKRRKFKNAFNGTAREITRADELDDGIKALISLNRSRFKEKEIPSPFADSRFEAFHRKIMPIFLARDILRLFFLYIDDNPIACLYIFKYKGRYLYYQIGFDTVWNKISPGVILFSYAFERAIEEGVTEFDFLQGDEPYKFRWTKQIRRNMKVELFRDSLKGEFHFIGNSLLKSTKGLVKKVTRHDKS